MDEALDHAVALMTEEGVGALSVSEVARRMGIRGPSLYKYFPSRHAIYDALFARGLAEAAGRGRAPPSTESPAACRASAPAARPSSRWAVEHPALAQLLHWRPVPGFEPSPAVFAPAEDDMADVRAEFAEAVRLGQLAPGADSDDVVRLYTVVLSGLISQQLANQPGVALRRGRLQPAHRHRDRPVPVRLRPLRSRHADARPRRGQHRRRRTAGGRSTRSSPT